MCADSHFSSPLFNSFLCLISYSYFGWNLCFSSQRLVWVSVFLYADENLGAEPSNYSWWTWHIATLRHCDTVVLLWKCNNRNIMYNGDIIKKKLAQDSAVTKDNVTKNCGSNSVTFWGGTLIRSIPWHHRSVSPLQIPHSKMKCLENLNKWPVVGISTVDLSKPRFMWVICVSSKQRRETSCCSPVLPQL